MQLATDAVVAALDAVVCSRPGVCLFNSGFKLHASCTCGFCLLRKGVLVLMLL